MVHIPSLLVTICGALGAGQQQHCATTPMPPPGAVAYHGVNKPKETKDTKPYCVLGLNGQCLTGWWEVNCENSPDEAAYGGMGGCRETISLPFQYVDAPTRAKASADEKKRNDEMVTKFNKEEKERQARIEAEQKRARDNALQMQNGIQKALTKPDTVKKK